MKNAGIGTRVHYLLKGQKQQHTRTDGNKAHPRILSAAAGKTLAKHLTDFDAHQQCFLAVDVFFDHVHRTGQHYANGVYLLTFQVNDFVFLKGF